MRIAIAVGAGLLVLGSLGWWMTREQCRASLSGHVGPVQCVAADPDGRFATGGVDHRVILWSPAGGRAGALEDDGAKVEAVAFGPGGGLARGSSDGTLRVRDGPSVRAHKDGVFALAFAGELLYSGGGDKLIRAWDPATLKERFVLRGHTGRVRALAVSPDQKWLASGGSGDSRVRLWPVGKPGGRPLSGAARRVHCLAFVEGGKALAAGDRDGKVHVWEVETGRERTSWPAHAGPVNGLVAVGETLVTAGDDGALIGWSLGGERAWERRNRAATNALTAGLGRAVISADADGRVRLWDVP